MNKYLEASIRLFGTPKWGVLRKQRLVAYNRAFPDGKISPNLRYYEVFCRDGMPPPIRAIPHLRWYAATILEPMRAEFGPCFVSGPYRHYWYNRLVVKGAPQSYHVWDRYCNNTIQGSALALDLTFRRGGPDDWADFAQQLMRQAGRGGGISDYHQSNFVHVDSRRVAWRARGN